MNEMQTIATAPASAATALNRRLVSPRETTSNVKALQSAANATGVRILTGQDVFKRHEAAEEEVQIAKEAKDLLIGLTTIAGVLAIAVVIATYSR